MRSPNEATPAIARGTTHPVASDCLFEAMAPQAHSAADESLVADDRAGLTPAQLVEQRLVSLLKGQLLMASQLRTRPTTGLRC